MRIGILTVHRAINVGAVLQCYALQEVLRSLGHDVKVIDYRQEKVERADRDSYGWKSWLNLLKGLHLRGCIHYSKLKKAVYKKYAVFDDFLTNYLILTDACNKEHIPQDFDAYIIGSDQLWNSNIFGYHDEVYWGRFQRPSKSKLIAYAPSSSAINLKSSSQEFIRQSLSSFTALSAREEEVAEYLNDAFSANVQTVIDPTLLADRIIWESMKTENQKDKNYVLVYGARPFKDNNNILYEMARPLAQQLNCEVRGLSYDTIPDYVNLVSKAKAVVSSSFHGIAFSLIFNRSLYAIKYGDEQDARYSNLLTAIGAEDMLYNVGDKLEPKAYNYQSINGNLLSLKSQSMKFLKNSLI